MPNSPSLTASASSPSQISALTFVSAVRESYPTNEVFAIPERTLPVALSQPPAPFLAARALSFWDFMRESKPSSSTPRPASAATSFVISSGNPKVSYSLNASSPESVLPPSDFTAEIRCERMESPESIVWSKRSSSMEMTFFMKSRFFSSSG